MIKKCCIIVLAGFFTAGAQAEVTSADKHGFTIVHRVTIAADRLEVYRATIMRVGEWWNGDHTFSGDSSNLLIDARSLGCFCEKLGDAGAGLVHMFVTFVNPATMLRLTGGLGPLGLMGVNGNMTWEFADADGGTEVIVNYAVGGYDPQGLDQIAPAVDFVLVEQFTRLKALIETGDATGTP